MTTAPAVLAEAPGRIRRLAADKGYDADWLRTDLREAGITPVIPGKRGRKRKIRHDKRRYRERWRIEATFNRLKDFRRMYGPGMWCDGSSLKRSGSFVQT